MTSQQFLPQYTWKYKKTSETQRFTTHTSIGCVGFRYTKFQERGLKINILSINDRFLDLLPLNPTYIENLFQTHVKLESPDNQHQQHKLEKKMRVIRSKRGLFLASSSIPQRYITSVIPESISSVFSNMSFSIKETSFEKSIYSNTSYFREHWMRNRCKTHGFYRYG